MYVLSIVVCPFLLFFWPLCCLFLFDIRFLIAPLVSSNSSYLRYMSLFCHIGVQSIIIMLCFVLFVCLRLVSCVPNVTSFPGLSILECPFGFSLTFISTWDVLDEDYFRNSCALNGICMFLFVGNVYYLVRVVLC